jgi:aspartyl-tRNA(Asn)/glutamyl-tRNA(Gln) amidotransferase subunit A
MSGDTALHFLTIAEASRLIRDRRLSPVDLTQAFLARIRQFDPRLNSTILVLEDQALADAHRAGAEIAAGAWRGPLHGIPIGLKDIYNTAGISTTAHSALFRDHVPAEDATTVRKLRAAGAVVLAKMATHEFATGGPSFDLPWPPARNPWDLDRSPGGSSSGSAAAIAAGLCMGATGTDTGGSIRIPAAMCGVAGHKPTYGLVSRRGILPLSFSLDHGGPICWTAEDCALMLDAMAGYDPADPGSADSPVGGFAAALDGDLAGLRIGVVRHFHETDVRADADMVAAFDAALPVFRDLGATVDDVTLAPLAEYNDVFHVICRSEAYAIHERYLQTTPELYGEFGRRRLAAGAMLRASDYVNAMRHRTTLVTRLADTMTRFDALITPGWHALAPRLDDTAVVAPPNYTVPFNITGSPALTVGNGLSASGLPLSIQIAGRPFEDGLVLKIGDAFEKATTSRAIRPPFALSPME